MFYLAMVLGLTSSLHCVGMCGPIALALPVHRRSLPGKTLGILLYNLGRITTYALLGAAIGSFGFLAGIGEWQNWLSVLAGILLLAGAIGSFRWWDRLDTPAPLRKVTARIQSQIGKQLKKDSFTSLAMMGMINGILPCGMVYLALVSALATPDAGSGALYMALFGAGTLPAMLATGFFGQWASLKWRIGFKKATPYLIALAGIVLILRGVVPDSGHAHGHDPAHTIPLCIE